MEAVCSLTACSRAREKDSVEKAEADVYKLVLEHAVSSPTSQQQRSLQHILSNSLAHITFHSIPVADMKFLSILAVVGLAAASAVPAANYGPPKYPETKTVTKYEYKTEVRCVVLRSSPLAP